MLDPITAIGLTASVVQLVDAGYSFITKCKEIYRSGSSTENLDIAAITSDLQNVNLGLIESLEAATREHRPPASTNNPDDISSEDKTDQVKLLPKLSTLQFLTILNQALLTLAGKCQDVSKELVKKLGQINEDCKAKKWRSFRQAVKNAWTRDDIEAMATRLLATEMNCNST